MGQLRNDLKIILEIEEEGQHRLEEAEGVARVLLEGYRERARQLLAATDEELERERAERFQQVQEQLAQRRQLLDENITARCDRMRQRADKQRETAVEKLLGWLAGED